VSGSRTSRREQPGERVHIVWFKRDLRVADHRPLLEAAARGPVVCLYIYEPELLRSAEFASRHLDFINGALRELSKRLSELGGSLVIRRGEAVSVLRRLSKERRIAGLWSHAETGNRITYDRDLRVEAWSQSEGIEWRQFRQDGVIRALRNRDGWSRRWADFMAAEPLPPPAGVKGVNDLASEAIMSAEELELEPESLEEQQSGGETAGMAMLDSFLERRGVNYRSDMSSPVEGWTGCSRLSPYLAWGCVSARVAHHALSERQADLRLARSVGPPPDSRWLSSLRSFQSRLRWRCHFMQKLEDEPELEFQNLCRFYDGLREESFDQDRFEAWKAGLTGYPMVDACMRAVAATGWLNFRMRAMVVSFASYHLWLHWRQTGIHLGRAFTDFEPGIHYSQVQMQSGTTGINTIRIYSPAKQVRDQDPKGVFIRRWLPELAGVPDSHLPEPHLMTLDEQKRSGCVIGRDYPAPIVDHSEAYREARRKIMSVRRMPESKAAAQKVYAKHGSRKRGGRRQGAPRKDGAQMPLL
jgi:deoxyribodipyrimidine photo-lyase